MIRPVLALLLLADGGAAAAAQADVVRVKVVSTDGSPVPSTVWRRISGIEEDEPTGPDGEVTFSPMSCTPGTALRVAPISPFYANAGDWRPCQANLLVKLQPYGYSALLQSVLGETPAGDLRLVQGTATATHAVELQTTLHAASDVGDWGRMAFAAGELSKLYRNQGQEEVATHYGGVALHGLAQLIALEQHQVLSEPLLTEVPGKGLARTPAADEVLEQSGVVRGKIFTRPRDLQLWATLPRTPRL